MAIVLVAYAVLWLVLTLELWLRAHVDGVRAAGGAGRAPGFPAQAQGQRPARGNLPFILREQGQAPHGGRIVLVGQHGQHARLQLAFAAKFRAPPVPRIPARRQRVPLAQGPAVRATGMHAHVVHASIDEARDGRAGAGALEQVIAAAVIEIDAQFHVQAGALFQLAQPVQVAAHGAAVLAEVRLVVRVGARAAEVSRFLHMAAAGQAAQVDQALPRQAAFVRQRPLQPGRQLQRIGGDALGKRRMAQHRGRAIGRVFAVPFVKQALAPRVAQRAGQRIRQAPVAVRPLHGGAAGGHAMAARGAQLEGALAPPRGLLQHDVDGTGDRLGGKLRRGGAHDLDALDQLRVQRVERKTGRHGHAIEHDQGIALAQPAQLELPALPRRGLRADGNAGQALQGVGQAALALAQQFLAADDDGGNGVAAPLLRRAGMDRHAGNGGDGTSGDGIVGTDVRRQRQREAAQQ